MPATSSEMRPSCGTRRSAMSRSDEDLHARDDGGHGAGGDHGGLLEHAVDPVADAHVLVAGLEVDVGGAALDGLLDHAVHELDDRGVLAGRAEVDRRSGRAGRTSGRPGADGCGGASRRRRPVVVVLERRGRAVAEVGVLEPLEQRVDVRRRRHRRADLVAGHDRDVVLREHVRGVGHGDQQRPLAGERDRHGLVAAGGGGRDELRGVGIDAVDAQGRCGRGRSARRRRARAGPRSGAPSATSSRSGRAAGVVGAARRHRSIASCSTKPRSTITSVSTRPEPPRREGVVTPLPFFLRMFWCPGLCWRIHVVAMVVAAARIASRGASRPVQRSNDAAP